MLQAPAAGVAAGAAGPVVRRRLRPGSVATSIRAAIRVRDPVKALKVTRASHEIGEMDFDALRAHGFDDEDIWDIAGISAFFGLSNRMANVINLRPNDEFYLMGRVPREKKQEK